MLEPPPKAACEVFAASIRSSIKDFLDGRAKITPQMPIPSWTPFRNIQRAANACLNDPGLMSAERKPLLTGIAYLLSMVIHSAFGDMGTDTPYEPTLDQRRSVVQDALINLLKKLADVLEQKEEGTETALHLSALAFDATSEYFDIYNEQILLINNFDQELIQKNIKKGGEGNV